MSRFRGLLVIACHSTIAPGNRPTTAAEIGRQLGVRFLVQGSVRRESGRIRITARLVDAATGGQLWAERYDQNVRADILAERDATVATIAATIAGRVEAACIERARRKPAAELGADGCLLRGVGHLAGYGRDANARAHAMFARAVKLDPGHALARAYLALTLYVEDFLNQARLGPSLARALELAGEAVELAREDSRCHRILAEIALATQAFERADHHSRRALELNPNDPHAAAYRAYVLAYLGCSEEAVGWMRRAICRDPFHPGWYWPALGRVLHYAGRHEDAVRAFRRVAAPRYFNLAYLAACHARLGHVREAERLVARALAAKPDLSVGGWFMLQPFQREEDRRGLVEGLLAAGLPS